tara:strand:+ start:118145 stop:118471 length:327 start_codon:yes stop_codon:yes gene_type:complete
VVTNKSTNTTFQNFDELMEKVGKLLFCNDYLQMQGIDLVECDEKLPRKPTNQQKRCVSFIFEKKPPEMMGARKQRTLPEGLPQLKGFLCAIHAPDEMIGFSVGVGPFK